MDAQDPADWSIDQVIEQVCSTPLPPWATGTELKPIINPDAVAKALRENDIDGDNLLALEDKDIKDDLGIGSFGQRRILKNIIVHIRLLSQKYQDALSRHSIQPLVTPRVSYGPDSSRDLSRGPSWSHVRQSVEISKSDANTRDPSQAPSTGMLKRPRDVYEDATLKTNELTTSGMPAHVGTPRSDVAGTVDKLSHGSSRPTHSEAGFIRDADSSYLNSLDSAVDEALANDEPNFEGHISHPHTTVEPAAHSRAKKVPRRIMLLPVDANLSAITRDSAFADAPIRNTDSTQTESPNFDAVNLHAPAAKRIKSMNTSNTNTHSTSPTKHSQPSQGRRLYRPDQLQPTKRKQQSAGLQRESSEESVEFTILGSAAPVTQAKFSFKSLLRDPKSDLQSQVFSHLAPETLQDSGAGPVPDPQNDVNVLRFDDSLASLLKRHPPTEEFGYPKYGDSDEEDRYTLVSEHTPQQDNQPSNKVLSMAEVEDVIHASTERFKAEWRTRSLVKTQIKAHAKWKSASKAKRLRQEVLAYCKHELALLERRIGRLVDGIHCNQWSKREDLEFQCQGIEVTVHQVEEYSLYVNILESDKEPLLPMRKNTQRVQKARPHTVLENGDEVLDSDSGDSFIVEDLDGQSLGDAEVSNLPTDHNDALLDYEHKKRPPMPVVLDANETVSEAEDEEMVVDSIEQPTTPPSKHTSTFGGNQGLSSDNDTATDESTSNIKNKHRQSSRKQAAIESAKRNPIQVPHLTDSDENSDLERNARIPQTEYRRLGTSKDAAIDLTRLSPRASSTRAGSVISNLSIRTPRPNSPGHTFGLKNKPNTLHGDAQPVHLAPSSIELDLPSQCKESVIESSDWRQIVKSGDPRLALAKAVTDLNTRFSSRVLDYVQNTLTTDEDLAEVLKDGLRAVIKMDHVINNVSQKHQDAARDLTALLISYANCCHYHCEVDINREQYHKCREIIQKDMKQFRRLLCTLLSRHITHVSVPAQALREISSDEESTDLDSEIEHLTANTKDKSKKRKTLVRKIDEKEIQRQQKSMQNRAFNQEQKMNRLLAQQAAIGLNQDELKIPINAEEPLVHLDPKIAEVVKPHQIEGIRFMWRELIEDPRHEGCLLAHTMGLGKTMQVISLLLAIGHCNNSADAAMQNHIPEHLRTGEGRTLRILVLCPASLIENWNLELEKWLHINIMMFGAIHVLDNAARSADEMLKRWFIDGGILLLSYDRYRGFVLPKNTNRDIKVHAKRRKWLTKGPDLVIADEAHSFKNPNAKITQAVYLMRTKSRIAMTGSPLNNNLDEYHTTINWIAPDYLGSLESFRARYVVPINAGLYSESSSYDRRLAMRRLHMLKKALGPKISRADITAISHQMPPKIEFFLTIVMTEKQKEAYKLFVEHLRGPYEGTGKTNPKAWSWLNILSLLLAHPSCFIKKLEDNDKEQKAVAAALRASTTPVEAQQVESDEEGYDSAVAAEADGVENIDVDDQPALVSAMQKAIDVFKNDPHRMSDPDLSTKSMLILKIVQAAAQVGDKTLIFSKSIPTLDYLESMVKDHNIKYRRIDGTSTYAGVARQRTVEAFNKSVSDRVLLVSTKAGGLGLNIQAANRVIIVDFQFNPMWEQQAVGRAYRIGQTKPVYVYRLLQGGTFEEFVHNRTVFKTQLFTRVVDEKNVRAAAAKNPGEFLFSPKEVEQHNLDECLGKDPHVLDQVLANVDCVRNIFLTETFYQEGDDALTEQEKAAAEEDLRLEQLEKQNPVKYHQEMLAKRNREIQAHKVRDDGLATAVPEASGPSQSLSYAASYMHWFDPNISPQANTESPSAANLSTETYQGAMPHQNATEASYGDEFVSSSQLAVQTDRIRALFQDDQLLDRTTRHGLVASSIVTFPTETMSATPRNFIQLPNANSTQASSSQQLTYKGFTNNDVVDGSIDLTGDSAATEIVNEVVLTQNDNVNFEDYINDTAGEEIEPEKPNAAAGCRPQ